MTSVVLNKVGMDLVDIEVQQKGTAFTDIFFQDPVLDYTKEYVLGVSELCVPLGDEPMLTQVPATENLIAVHRKGYYAPDAATGLVRTWYPVYYGELRANAPPHVHVGHPHAGAALDVNGNVLPMNIIGSTWTKLKAQLGRGSALPQRSLKRLPSSWARCRPCTLLLVVSFPVALLTCLKPPGHVSGDGMLLTCLLLGPLL